MTGFPNVRNNLSAAVLLLAACASDGGSNGQEPLINGPTATASAPGTPPNPAPSNPPSPPTVSPTGESPSSVNPAPVGTPNPSNSTEAPGPTGPTGPDEPRPMPTPSATPSPVPAEPASGGAGGGVVEPRPAGGAGGAGGELGAGGAAGAGGGPAVVDGPCSPPTEYRNLFVSLLEKSTDEVEVKVQGAFDQMFHGGDNETVYYASGDEGYILDVASDDIRSEGQSYGMMIALQLDKQQEFDAIWRWSKRVMQQNSGLFGWHASRSGQLYSTGSAPDGEEYFATALIFASERWGNDTGIDYMAEAQRVLGAMYEGNLFDREQQLVRFVAQSNYTDPSYILPTFYEIWACHDEDPERAAFWKAAAETGREFFPKTAHPETGLAPYLANYDGSARDDFNSDSYRVVGNIMMDHHFFGVDPWQTTWAEKYAAFFLVDQQSSRPGAEFRLDGTVTVSYNRPEAALAAQNAMVAFGVPPEQGRYFVQYLWDMDIPTGQYRYYAGMLYMLALLHVSGNFHLYY